MNGPPSIKPEHKAAKRQKSVYDRLGQRPYGDQRPYGVHTYRHACTHLRTARNNVGKVIAYYEGKGARNGDIDIKKRLALLNSIYELLKMANSD